MKDFKVPAIAGIITLFLILIINLFINTFFIAFIRSFISGIVVFGVFYGVIFLFKNYLGINFESLTDQAANKSNENKEDSKVDVTVDDSSFEIDSNEYNYGTETEADENGKDIEEPVNENIDISDKEVEELDNLDETKELNSVNPDVKDNKNENNSMVEDDLDFDNISETPENNVSSEENKYDFDYNTEKKEELDDNKSTIKDKLGIDASYEDLAKAIRTELKKDKQ